MNRGVTISAVLLFAASAGIIYFKLDPLIAEVDQAVHGPYTEAERLREYSGSVQFRLKPDFDKAGIAYPPARITLVILKDEKQVQLFAEDANSTAFRFIRDYPILAASGRLGPKLREGDRQVPEGFMVSNH